MSINEQRPSESGLRLAIFRVAVADANLRETYKVVVMQLRIPLRSAPFRSQVEQVPQWPHKIDMPAVLARLARRKQQFGTPEVVNGVDAFYKDIQHRQLRSILTFTVVIQIVRI